MRPVFSGPVRYTLYSYENDYGGFLSSKEETCEIQMVLINGSVNSLSYDRKLTILNAYALQSEQRNNHHKLVIVTKCFSIIIVFGAIEIRSGRINYVCVQKSLHISTLCSHNFHFSLAAITTITSHRLQEFME